MPGCGVSRAGWRSPSCRRSGCSWCGTSGPPSTGTWDFNPDYTVGLTLPGGMAVEELVFFTVIPICGLLTLETVRSILRRQAHA